MQLKHLACVWVKDLLILMEAYCLCCNSWVLDVRLVRTKANLYIPSDLCHIYVGYCGSIAVVELNLMDISGHLYSMSRYLVTLL